MSGGIRHSRYDITVDPSLGRFRRVVTSWLGLIVLAFNILGAGGLPASAAEGGSTFAQEFQGDRIVVCTAAGMVVMDLDGNVINTGGGAAHHTDLCVFCLPLMHGGAQAPAMVAVPVEADFPREETFLAAEPAAAIPARLPGAASPRAPPHA